MKEGGKKAKHIQEVKSKPYQTSQTKVRTIYISTRQGA
jgi:hypothetical protein